MRKALHQRLPNKSPLLKLTTSSLAEGVNNVIKSLKRKAFGFRYMDYFRLKIMQVCGYLNSRYIKFAEMLGT